jgi:hypothetical protein
MGLKERSEERRRRMVGRVIQGHEDEVERPDPHTLTMPPHDHDAEERELEFWISKTPQQRLSAYAAARKYIHEILGHHMDQGAVDDVTFAMIAKQLMLGKLKE